MILTRASRMGIFGRGLWMFGIFIFAVLAIKGIFSLWPLVVFGGIAALIYYGYKNALKQDKVNERVNLAYDEFVNGG